MFAAAILLLLTVNSATSAKNDGILKNYTTAQKYCRKELNIQEVDSEMEEMKRKCLPRCVFLKMDLIGHSGKISTSFLPSSYEPGADYCNGLSKQNDSCLEAASFAKCINSSIFDLGLDELSLSCARDTNTTLDAKKYFNPNNFKDKKLACYNSCVLKKFDLILAGAKFNATYVGKMLGSEKVAKEMEKECYQKVDEDACVMVASRAACAWEFILKKNSDLEKLLGDSASILRIIKGLFT